MRDTQPPILSKPLHVGLFMPSGPGARWRGDGITHTIEFILGGFEQQGRLGRDIRFTLFTSAWLEAEVRQSLKETLTNLAAINIVRLPSRKTQVAQVLEAIFSLGGLLRRRKKIKRLSLEDLPANPSVEFLRKYYEYNQFRAVTQTEGRRIAAKRAVAAMAEYAAAHPEERPAPSVTPSVTESGLAPPPPLSEDNDQKESPSAEAYTETYSTVTLSGMQIFNFLLRALRGIPIVRRVTIPLTDKLRNRVNYEEAVYLAKAATTLKDRHSIDVWWVPQPNVDATEFLKGPVLANFWDFVIGEFGYYWDFGAMDHIYNRVKLTLLSADAVLTQSFHNLDLKIVLGFDVPKERVSVAYLSGPAHYTKYVPSFEAAGKKTPESRFEAAEIIRTHIYQRILSSYPRRTEVSHQHGNEVENLSVFPFETAKFALVSTQNRPYKNVAFLVDCFLKLVNQGRLDAYLIMTTEYNLSDPNDKIAQVIHKRKGVGRVFCLSRVPNKVHAALYHCATATLHPSHTEGGVGAFSFMEGMIMGTPGLVGRGDYTVEGRRLHPEYDRLVMEPNDRKAAMAQIEHIMNNPDAMYEELLPLWEQHKLWTWADVSESYLSVLRSLVGDPRAAEPPKDFRTLKRAYHSLRPLDGSADMMRQAAE